MIRHRSSLLALVPALLLVACGGGGGSDPAPLPPIDYHNVRPIESDPHMDGDIDTRGRVRTAGVCGITGDLDTASVSTGSMQYLSFDHAVIPADAEILAVVLEVYQETVVGDPYVTHGVVMVDQMQFGPNLLASDYWLVPVESGTAILSTNDSLGWKYADVTTAFQRSRMAGWTRTSFRLRWSDTNANDDGNFDFAMFNDGEDACGSGHRARIVVRYR